MQIVGNEALLRAFVFHFDKFKEEHMSEDGDVLNVSIILSCVSVACDVWIVLQDAPL